MDDTDVKFKRLFALPLNKILSFFQKKEIRPSGTWTDVWQEEHNKAFVVANVAQADYLQELYAAVEKAIREGIPFSQFKKEIKKLPEDWKKMRLPTIYNTNLNVAYSRGRYESMIANKERRPFWRYKCQMLPTSRESHKALNGKVFSADDPIWQTLFPPNGWGCKCEVEPLTAADVKSENLKVEKSKGNLKRVETFLNNDTIQLVTGYKDPQTGVITAPAAGWNYNPGIKDYSPDYRKYNSFIAANLKVYINAAKLKLPFIKGKHDFKADLKAISDSKKTAVNSAIAYEARRRGLDVLPTETKGKITKAFESLKFTAADKADLINELTEGGNGTRFLISIKQDKKNIFLIAENVKGMIYFLNPGSGEILPDLPPVKKINVSRIDTILFSDNMKKYTSPQG